MELQAIVGISGVPFILALVQLLKPFVTDSRWYPLIALAAGVVLNVAVSFAVRTDPVSATLAGLIAGLTASGLYSQGKAIAGQ